MTVSNLRDKCVLSIEDEDSIRDVLRRIFDRCGSRFLEAKDAGGAMDALEKDDVDLVLLDLHLGGESDGMSVLKRVRAGSPGLPVIVITGYGTVKTAVDAVKTGAYDFITKPFNAYEVVQAAERAVRTKVLFDELSRMRKSKLNTEELLTAISSLLIAVDARGTVMEWNATATEFFGCPRERAVGSMMHDLDLAWDREMMDAAVESCLTQRTVVPLDDVPYTDAHGNEGVLGVTLYPIITAKGRVNGYILLGKDVTRQRSMEAQLAQAQKMEAIGQLAAGIAHEINTPMQYIGDSAVFLKDSYGELLEKHLKPLLARDGLSGEERDDLEFMCEEIPKGIGQIEEGVAHVSRIVRAMKDFSHPDGEEMVPVDINGALESVINISRNEWKYVADMETDFESGLPAVHCFPGSLNQAFLNIVVNAAHAIEDALKGTDAAKGSIRISTSGDERGVEVRIRDTGGGIPEHVRRRMFEPFFTTKEKGRGTGQGLAIARSVVEERHAGTLRCETEEGRGTEFIITIPAGTAE